MATLYVEIKGVEVIWLEVTPKKSRGFLVAVGHRPPYTSKYLNKDIEDLLSRMLTRVSMNLKKLSFLEI